MFGSEVRTKFFSDSTKSEICGDFKPKQFLKLNYLSYAHLRFGKVFNVNCVSAPGFNNRSSSVSLCRAVRRESRAVDSEQCGGVWQAEGVQQLVMGSAAGGLRAPLCDLTLLAVQLVVGHFVAAPPDLRLVREILDGRLQQYPAGAWFLLFLGRLQLVCGRARPALATYARVAAVPRLWPQLRHLTYWECMWASSIELQWRDAAEFAARLLAESAWSRTVYAYARAAFLLQLRDLSPAEQRVVEDLLRCAPRHRQRIAGKSLPMEKFVARRCERWAARAHLALPGLELLCLWNMFPALAADPARAHTALQAIDEAEEEVHVAGARGAGGAGSAAAREGRARPLLPDTGALMLLLRGSMHVASRRYRDAIPILNRVLEMKDEIQEDTFIVPYAMFEMASCYVSIGDRIRGQSLLREIRRNFHGFLLESRLQFRVHASLARLRERPDEEAPRRDHLDHLDHLQMESSRN